MEKIKHKHNFQKGLSLLSLQLLRLKGERLGDGGMGVGVRWWVTCDGDEIIDLLGVIIAASLVVVVGGRLVGNKGRCRGGREGERGLCYHVAHPSVSRTRLMEGLSRSSMAGRASPRGEWNSFLCSSRSLPS